MPNEDFLTSLVKTEKPNPEGNVFDGIWTSYERVILHSLVTSFGLDFLVQDQTGGDVDTIRSVRDDSVPLEARYKTPTHFEAYENRGAYDTLAALVERIQQRPDFVIPIKGIELPDFTPNEYKKLAFEAEALVGGTLGAVVGGSVCMAVMETGAVAGGVLGSGFVLCAMGLNMVNRAANKKKQAVRIREEVKGIISFYEKLGKASSSYKEDLEKVLAQFNKSKGKMAKILECKSNWQDFSKVGLTE